jgi:hypothetical protein
MYGMQEYESAIEVEKGNRTSQPKTSGRGKCASVGIAVLTFSEEIT